MDVEIKLTQEESKGLFSFIDSLVKDDDKLDQNHPTTKALIKLRKIHESC